MKKLILILMLMLISLPVMAYYDDEFEGQKMFHICDNDDWDGSCMDLPIESVKSLETMKNPLIVRINFKEGSHVDMEAKNKYQVFLMYSRSYTDFKNYYNWTDEQLYQIMKKHDKAGFVEY